MKTTEAEEIEDGKVIDYPDHYFAVFVTKGMLPDIHHSIAQTSPRQKQRGGNCDSGINVPPAQPPHIRDHALNTLNVACTMENATMSGCVVEKNTQVDRRHD